MLGLRGDDPNSLKVPTAPRVDTTKAAREATIGNIRNMDEIANLATKANDLSSNQFLTMMEKLIPGFSKISGTIADSIKSRVSGELPSDTRRLISQAAAEKGIARGTTGSEFDDFGELRDLGLTSLQISKEGFDAANRWIAAMASGAPQFNFSSMFVTPAQRIATQQWNETNRFNRQFLKNQISMLPSNLEMGAAQGMDNVATLLMTYAQMGMGGMGGAGGAAGGAAAGGAAGGAAGSMGASAGFGGASSGFAAGAVSGAGSYFNQ